MQNFFSFGTNDLTQLTYGFSRDDASKFINEYKKKGILEHDPFTTIDQHGVGKLVKLAVKKARDTKKNISLGICGEHGGEVKSIEFCDEIGLDYVSCSPYRVPIARLAAAQAKNKKQLIICKKKMLFYRFFNVYTVQKLTISIDKAYY